MLDFNSRIMFYIDAISGGGAERVMSNLANRFFERGYCVTLVTSFSTEDEYELSAGIKRLFLDDNLRFDSMIKRNIFRIKRLRRIIKAEKPIVLITFMSEPNIRGVIATKGLPTKSIISVRVTPEMEYSGFIRRIVAKLLLPSADGCVFQTAEQMEWFSRKLQKKSVIIPNAVAPVFFRIERNPHKNLIVTLGRLSEQKNQDLLIKSFSIVKRRVSDAKLFIYGQGELACHLDSLIKSLNLEGSVVLQGKTDCVDEVMSKADLFVLSSDYEGMPNALMEAMASGVPCVSTDCQGGGARFLIDNNQDGLIVPIGDERQMSEAMIRVLLDYRLKERLGKNAKEKSFVYDPINVLNMWLKYVDRVANDR